MANPDAELGPHNKAVAEILPVLEDVNSGAPHIK